MAIGLGVLRLSPGAFWSMTPAELAAAIEGLSGGPRRSGSLAASGVAAPFTRTALLALMRRYPDGG